MTIERLVPENDPNTVRTEIAAIITGSLVGSGDGQIRSMYDYRTLPNLTAIEASITYFGGLPMQSPFLGGPYYNFVLDVRVKHDNTPAGLESAENAVVQLSKAIWLLLSTTEATSYKDLYPYSEDQFPGAPSEVVNIRRGYLFIRVIPI